MTSPFKKHGLGNNKALTGLIVAGFIFAATGCAAPGQKEEVPPSEPVRQETTTEVSDNIPPSNHAVNPNPEPLSEDEATLSIEGYGTTGAFADNDLTIADMLMYAAQDEYAARRQYAVVMQTFGEQKPYANILQGEESHLAYVNDVMTAYGMPFPNDESEAVVTVPENLLAAAQLGVQGEMENISMYDLFLSHELPDDVAALFQALKSGSESHLNAFQKQVDRLS